MGISCPPKLKYKNIFAPVKVQKIKNSLKKESNKQQVKPAINSNNNQEAILKMRMANTLKELRELFERRDF
jgi:hypothetical protein